MSTAEAKGGPGFYRQVEVTPDGRYLLISGRVSMEDEDSEIGWKDRPAGLLIVDTETMEVVYREKSSSGFNLSPDGRWLLVTGEYWDEDLADETGFGGEVAFGLGIIDLTTLKETAHLWPDTSAGSVVFSPDSRYAYAMTDGPGMEEPRRTGHACYEECFRLNVIDLASGEVIGGRFLTAYESVRSLAPTR